jgi:phosphatidylserine decarboxylase
MFTLRTLREGLIPFLALGIAALLGALWSPWLTLGFGALLLFSIGFFRDPARRGPEDPAAILSPADGVIVGVEQVREEEFLAGDAIRVAIFLSVFDVHVQRSPISGAIRWVRYHPGKHLDARDRSATLSNENRMVAIEGADGFRVAVRQIAGRVARRIVGWAGPEARLERGDRLGMIRFGSRVELFLPLEVQVAVQLGQHVKGGETVVAQRP